MTSAADDAVTTLDASGFAARCLELLDELAEHGGEIVITRDGHPVARLTPCPEPPKPRGEKPRGDPKQFFGADRGRIRILGDISEPIDVVWEAAEAGPWDDRL